MVAMAVWFVIWFTDQNPLRLSALGSGFEAASEPVSAFQIRKTDTGSDASAKPPPPVAELTAASPVKNYHPKQTSQLVTDAHLDDPR